MPDFNSSLPVRTQSNGDVVAFIADGTTPTQLLAVDASGRLTIKLDDGVGNPINSQTLSASQWLQVTDPAIGPASPGTAAVFSELSGGIYNLVAPTLTGGQQASLQLSASGQLIVTASNLPAALDTNYGVVGASTLRTAAQIGNATGAADFNAGATGAQTLRVQANQGAPSNAAGGWFVRPTDGTNSQSYTAAGEAKVSVTQPLPAGTNAIGTVNVSNLPTTVDTNYGTVGASTIRAAAQIGNATGAADFNNGATGVQTLRVAANLAVAGADVTVANPVPVVVTSTTPGTAINDYKRAIGIAAGASDNHDYTVTALKTLHLDHIESSGSGKAKMEVEVETGVATGVFLTKWSQFNSTATPNMTIHIDNAILVAAGVRVRIVMTNKDLVAQDMYSTISGYELP